ncbi:MAG TPA: hypothetical protein VE086_09670 [Chthoniobacterales bacterium]|nr:hypothetical protein [Chthoniobacterales bacterium]
MAERVARQPGHETRDANVRAVTWFAVGLVISAIAIHLAVGALWPLFAKQHPSPDPPSRIVLEPHVLAPEPRLQANPIPEMNQLRASEDKKLNSYGWIDKQHGIARIPIDRAMDLVAQRGLPTRGPGTQNSSGKTPEQMRQAKAAVPNP